MYHRQEEYENLIPCITPRCSYIRLFNAIPQCPPLDIYVNDEWLIARGIEYKEMTPYF